MTKVFDQALLEVSAEVAAREALVSFQDIKARSRSAAVDAARNAGVGLRQSGCGVIAEFDRCVSEANGEGDAGEYARNLEILGAKILSCPVRRGRFGDVMKDLREVRAAVDLPVFVDDLIVDPYQIHEARVHGADMLALHVWSMDQPKLESLLDRIESLGMTAMVVIRTPEEAHRAATAGASVVGIDVQAVVGSPVTPHQFSSLCSNLPAEILRVAIGGCRTPRDLIDYAIASADAILARHGQLAQTRALVTAGQHPACPSR